MNREPVSSSETVRITTEYDRRAREIPEDYYCLSRPANLMMHQQTLRSCLALLRRSSVFPLAGRRIADIGCGSGTWLLEFMRWGAEPSDLAGIDLIPGRIERARLRIPQADLRTGNATKVPWPEGSFDLVSQFMAFTSILEPAVKQAAAAEMLRVLKPGGVILWFDFRIDNPANRQVRGIRAPEIRSLFPECGIRLMSAMLAPPLTRLTAGWAWPLAEILHAMPFLRTHYAGLISKNRPK